MRPVHQPVEALGLIPLLGHAQRPALRLRIAGPSLSQHIKALLIRHRDDIADLA
jgi:hypothetical protein